MPLAAPHDRRTGPDGWVGDGKAPQWSYGAGRPRRHGGRRGRGGLRLAAGQHTLHTSATSEPGQGVDPEFVAARNYRVIPVG